MEPATLAVLSAAALATSILSGILGMAGGIVLLTVMLLFMEPLVAIPVHGAVQLVSNSARAWIQRPHVQRSVVARYALLLLPMGFLGLAVARRLPPDGIRAGIGLFVLLATWRPAWLLFGTHPEATHPTRRFLWLGGGVGFLSVTVGATGPLIAPFFLNIGLSRQGIVGTKAACQVLGHLAKLIVFGVAGFAFREFAVLLVLLWGAVVVGTWIGSRLLERVNDRVFQIAYKTVLTVIALRLILWEGWKLAVG